MVAPNASTPSTAMRHFGSQNRRTVMLVIELAVLLAFVMLPWCVTDTLGDRVTDLMIFAIMRPGPQCRGRLHRTAPPRHRSVLWHRSQHRGHPDDQQLSISNRVYKFSCYRDRRRGAGRPCARLADASGARRLPGSGDAGIWRSCQTDAPQSGGDHQRLAALNPIPRPVAPVSLVDWWRSTHADLGRNEAMRVLNYLVFYYLALVLVVAVVLLLRNLERSRLGRAWVAIREDELAANCMAIDVPRVKLLAFALALRWPAWPGRWPPRKSPAPRASRALASRFPSPCSVASSSVDWEASAECFWECSCYRATI